MVCWIANDTCLFWHKQWKRADNKQWKQKDQKHPCIAKRTISSKKMLYAMFFNSSGPIVQVPCPSDHTVTGRFYKNSVLKKVKKFYNKKWPSKGWSGIHLLHDNSSSDKCEVVKSIHGHFLSLHFHCLLSALHCGSNMCTQVSSPVSKLEITRLLQPLYVFKSSRAHLRRCIFCSSVSKWGTHLVQTFLRSKRFFRIVCTLPFDISVQLAVSLTDNRTSSSTAIFTAAMLALITEVLGHPGRVSSSTENFPALKALTHLKTVCIEMVWGPYIPHNSLNICFESILSLMRYLI